MVMLATNYCRNFSCPKKITGLTLIEILIALAIIGIALSAVIKATTENIRATSHLQNKMIAMWVGKEVLNKARVGLLNLPSNTEKMKETSDTLGRTWYWQANKEETSNRRINKIMVQVFAREDEDETPLITLESYVYREE